MTKWGSGETRNQNYSSMGSALVMLSFMSVGYNQFLLAKFTILTSVRYSEGWNQFMHN
jgi:hypothetical protein